MRFPKHQVKNAVYEPRNAISTEDPKAESETDKRMAEESINMVITYLRDYNHRVFICTLCSEDWSTSEEFFDHVHVHNHEENVKKRKELELAISDVTWKDEYNNFRNIANGVICADHPLKAVPYGDCEDFKDTGECVHMKKKRREALKKLLKEPVKKMYNSFKSYIRAKQELEECIMQESSARKAHIIVRTFRGSARRRILRELNSNLEIRMNKHWKEMKNRYKCLKKAVKLMIQEDMVALDEIGRRRIDPATYEPEAIEIITESILSQVKFAAYFTKCWGDATACDITERCVEDIVAGAEQNRISLIRKGEKTFNDVIDSLERGVAFFSFLASNVFFEERYCNIHACDETNKQMSDSINVALKDVIVEFKNNWADIKFDAESYMERAFEELKQCKRTMPNLMCQSRVSEVFNDALHSCRQRLAEVKFLMENIRDDSYKEDWDLLDSHVFLKVIHMAADPQLPVYSDPDAPISATMNPFSD